MITLEQLLALRSLAKSTANTDAACAVTCYLMEAEPEKVMAFDFFRDVFNPDFVPLAVFSQYETAVQDCDKEAQEELRRIMSEFMSTEEYSRQVEAYNRLHQLGGGK